MSTYTTFNLDSKDMAKTLSRIASTSPTKSEIDYYNAHIGKVKNVDELLADYKLYSYAMKAYGLTDFMQEKAFMKKVLTSDLSDPKSFANRLNDPRYKQIAAAFNFDVTTKPTAQTTTTESAMFGSPATKTTSASIGLYQQSFTSEATAVAAETDYYDTTIGSVKTVDQLLGDNRLISYVLKAYGIDPANVDFSSLRSMLTSSSGDPNSFLSLKGSTADKSLASQFNFNSDGTILQTTPENDVSYYKANIASIKSSSDLVNDPRLFEFVKMAFGIPLSVTAAEFNASAGDASLARQYGLSDVLQQFDFQPDGTVAQGASAQTGDQITATTDAYAANYQSLSQSLGQKSAVMTAYNSTVPSFTTDAAAAADTAYYKATIGSIKSIVELTNDSTLFNYIKTAYDLQAKDPKASDTTLKYDLQNSVEDPAYAKLTGLASIVDQFNFQADGTVAIGAIAQDTSQESGTIDAFKTGYQLEHTTTEANAIANYEKRISSVKTIDQFFESNAAADSNSANDSLPELYQMALRSFGIGESEISKSKMKKILESDPYDPNSYVSKLKDSRFLALAKAYNFDSKGKLQTPVTALSTAQIDAFISQYSKSAKLGLSGAALKKATSDTKAAATYFVTNIAGVQTASDLLKDTKLTDFLLRSNGLDPKKISASELKKAFASDPSKSNSFINTASGAALKPIVDAFNFGKDGTLTDKKMGSAQNKLALDTTNDLFLHQTLETQAGASDDGVRLALYFQRKAPGINSLYDIMADSALYKVVTTTFGLPSSVSSMKVDAQAKLLGKLIDISDLHDPAKLSAFLNRFSVQYDLKNTAAAYNSPAIAILQPHHHSVGVSSNTLLSIAQLKA